jgi:hypothetical protein
MWQEENCRLDAFMFVWVSEGGENKLENKSLQTVPVYRDEDKNQ